MMLWASYLLLMFCYDKNFLGDHHPVTFMVGAFCLVGSILMFWKQLRLSAWGANLRMAYATVIVFWVPVEILGRLQRVLGGTTRVCCASTHHPCGLHRLGYLYCCEIALRRFSKLIEQERLAISGNIVLLFLRSGERNTDSIFVRSE